MQSCYTFGEATFYNTSFLFVSDRHCCSLNTNRDKPTDRKRHGAIIMPRLFDVALIWLVSPCVFQNWNANSGLMLPLQGCLVVFHNYHKRILRLYKYKLCIMLIIKSQWMAKSLYSRLKQCNYFVTKWWLVSKYCCITLSKDQCEFFGKNVNGGIHSEAISKLVSVIEAGIVRRGAVQLSILN